MLALTAGFSQQSGLASHPGARPIPDKPNLSPLGERLNTNTIAIVSGNPNATYLNIAYDLSDVLDDGDNFRILPVIGKGGGQNIRDVRFLKGIDLGITQSIILNEYRESNEIGNIDDKIVYIAKLFNEEMHVVVRADSGIDSLEQLSGKKVNFSDIGSGSQLSTRDVFKRLGIQAQEVNMGQGDALEKLKAGEIAATILIAGKPTGAMGKLKAADGLRFLPVQFAKPLQADYLPAVLGHGDYPGVVEDGHDVNTIAVSAVLIAYNWPRDTDRYRRIANFVAAFFPKLAELQKPPHHPKWRETNLAAVLPGWTRFPAAQEWLDQNRPSETANAATRQQFDQFLATQRPAGAADVSADDREQLFQEFLKWQARERP
ncbi:MAG TPA: TAXI family TRAP transporter solute-binding subunit [Xanthobacteraceae bacterium]|nr:TAXI family TRAP transporter solute-binding subunit [Xanthobacteraceae bacterium]